MTVRGEAATPTDELAKACYGMMKEMYIKDYSELLDWDFVMGKEGTGLETKYSLRPAPRKKVSQAQIEEAWSEARATGFDINRLLTGGSPFKKD